ncbi:serine hydrolase [Kordiimonas aestuarii]|uniref:serine hydrolase n=1 Tax=Kordiimonas aestuarii TaxID=1005925 RepID=UPI0021D072C7|nr:serine hydrolase [Kordiimonas aestuarii]
MFSAILKSLTVAAVLLAGPMTARADALTEAEIKSVVSEALERFNTPGMAVGIVKDGEVIHLKGYGIRDMNSREAVTPDTLFRIASTTKAFTSAALAVLVDEGKLGWDDKVIDYLPDFRMMDAWVTREFTVRDLLTHRSGLGAGAGDLMLWPEPSGFTREEIIKNLRHFKPVSSFRSEYAYDNLLYIVAGEVVAAASGTSWEDFVQTRILDPLGMGCFAGDIPMQSLGNVATPHGWHDGKLVTIPRNAIGGKATVSAAAGGMVCNIRGMSTWMLTQLAGGISPKGIRVFSQARRDEMWQSETILGVGSLDRNWNNTHFRTYALAWRKADVMGREVISHTGTLSGMQAYLSLVPELDLGIIILNNGSHYGARTSVMQAILHGFLDAPERNWVTVYDDWLSARLAAKAAAEGTPREGTGEVFLPLDAYAGSYRDAWLGTATVKMDGDALLFSSEKAVKLTGTLEPFEQNTFVIHWDDPMIGEDAYVRFETNLDGKVTGFKMAHMSADFDFSFDIQDLNFIRD